MNSQMQATDPTGGGADLSYLGAGVTYRLPQPGGRPNVFQGAELAMAMSFTPGLPYWYEINLYRTAEQGFVVAIRTFFQSEEEVDFVKSWSFSSIHEALAMVETYDPSIDVHVPAVDMSAASPADLAATALALKAEVESRRAHYAGLVGEMLAEIEAAGIEL
ncbi:MAG: hypothetical protein AAF307_05130 [Pseudomonadota bacterium]